MERKSVGMKSGDSEMKLAPGVDNLENRVTADEIARESMTKGAKRNEHNVGARTQR